MSRLVEQKKEDVVAAKRTRVPIHSSRSVLDVRGLDHANFSYRWVKKNDPYQVERFQLAGYVLVDKKGKNIPGDEKVDSTAGLGSAYVVTGKDGVPLVLMAIPIELFNEDQAAKAQDINAVEEDQKRKLREQFGPNHPSLTTTDPLGISVGPNNPTVPKIRRV